MHAGLKRSELELRGPRVDIKIGRQSSRGVGSAPFSALSPMPAARRHPPLRKKHRTLLFKRRARG
eukprot:590138-Alexandrium_andersonii.AAC.1